MAQPIKDTSVGGQINPTDAVRKPETMIIPARELVQVFAKVCSHFTVVIILSWLHCWFIWAPWMLLWT